MSRTASEATKEPVNKEVSWRSIGLSTWEKTKETLLRYLQKRWFIALAGAGLLALALVPFPYDVKCEVTCEPSQRRFVAAPFEAKLLECLVKPGEPVSAGQLMAKLDGSELKSELAMLGAEAAQASQRRHAAMAIGDAATAELERLEVERIASEMHILEQRQTNLQIRSPIDGIVVSGNLERATGAPLSVGEDLFEVAPLDDYIAEIAVPESEIGYVAMECQRESCFSRRAERAFMLRLTACILGMKFATVKVSS